MVMVVAAGVPHRGVSRRRQGHLQGLIPFVNQVIGDL